MDHHQIILRSRIILLQQQLESEKERYLQVISSNKEFSEAKLIRGKISILEKESEIVGLELQKKGA